jgi:hypothetical protein
VALREAELVAKAAQTKRFTEQGRTEHWTAQMDAALAHREAEQVQRVMHTSERRHSVGVRRCQERAIWAAGAAIDDAKPAGDGGLGDGLE